MMKPFDSIGAIACARYAFAPNYYHYCGPDTGSDLSEYVSNSLSDEKLVEYLNNFETLYPYLKSIAQANNIIDPLDRRVVEAYWVGNYLLDRVNSQQTYLALTEGQQLHRRLDKKSLVWLLPKIDRQAKLHHSFHVFNIFTRTGHRTVAHTVDTMDQCRIGWGKVVKNKLQITNDKARISDDIWLDTQKLIYRDGRLQFVSEKRTVINPIENLELTLGDWVSFHWGFVCEKISKIQVDRLSKLTNYHLELANLNL